MKIQNAMPISKIREKQQETPEAKIVRLESELAAAKQENLMIMEATADVYEELLAIKQQIGGTN